MLRRSFRDELPDLNLLKGGDPMEQHPKVTYLTSEEHTKMTMARFFVQTSMPRLIKKRSEQEQEDKNI